MIYNGWLVIEIKTIRNSSIFLLRKKTIITSNQILYPNFHIFSFKTQILKDPIEDKIHWRKKITKKKKTHVLGRSFKTHNPKRGEKPNEAMRKLNRSYEIGNNKKPRKENREMNMKMKKKHLM